MQHEDRGRAREGPGLAGPPGTGGSAGEATALVQLVPSRCRSPPPWCLPTVLSPAALLQAPRVQAPLKAGLISSPLQQQMFKVAAPRVEKAQQVVRAEAAEGAQQDPMER